ncbi:hypothetical protein HY992_05630 [Candidatus Micrarchaeota archaeon]|nr:hypothetical protein [Candidatus Micrarchaeota archaeon]
MCGDPSKSFFRRLLSSEVITIPRKEYTDEANVYMIRRVISWKLRGCRIERKVESLRYSKLMKRLAALFIECGIDETIATTLLCTHSKEAEKIASEEFDKLRGYSDSKRVKEVLHRYSRRSVFGKTGERKALIRTAKCLESKVVEKPEYASEHLEEIGKRERSGRIGSDFEDVLRSFALGIPVWRKGLKSLNVSRVILSALGVSPWVTCTVPDLIDALNCLKSNEEVYSDLLGLIGKIRTPSTTEVLLREFVDCPYDTLGTRMRVMALLGESKDERATRLLLVEYDELLSQLEGKVRAAQLDENTTDGKIRARVRRMFANSNSTEPNVDQYERMEWYLEVIAKVLAHIGDIKALDALMHIFGSRNLGVDALKTLGKKHPERVFEEIRQLYLQVPELDAKLRDACIEVMTAIHNENLKKSKKNAKLGKHYKEWGHEIFEVLEDERVGWTALYFKASGAYAGQPARFMREVYAPDADLSHHYIQFRDQQIPCYSTSFHMHPNKHVVPLSRAKRKSEEGEKNFMQRLSKPHANRIPLELARRRHATC